MRRFAETLPTLRGGDLPRFETRDDATAPFNPLLLAKAAKVTAASPAERSRTAQAEILERTIGRLDRLPSIEVRRSAIPSIDQHEEDTLKARVAAAVLEAKIEAERDREAAVAAARAEERKRAETALAEARKRWAEGEAQDFATTLSARLDALETDLSTSLARVVGPLLDTAVRDRAIARFREILHDLLSGPRRSTIVVKGPSDLLAALSGAWGERSGIRFEVADRAELVADIGSTRIETALAPFKSALAEALAAPAPADAPKDRAHV